MKFNDYTIAKTLTASALAFFAIGSAAQVVSPYTVQPGSLMSPYWVYSGAFKEYRNKSLHPPASKVRELQIASGQTLPAETSGRRMLVFDEISTRGGDCP